MGHIEHLTSLFDLANKAVADIGAGSGVFSAQLMREGARVSAIEIDSDKVEMAKAKLSSAAAVLEGRAEDLPLADGSQDLLCFFFSFHHIPHEVHAEALQEASRVLKPGGRLHVVEPFPYGSMFDVVRMVEDETEVRTRSHALLSSLAEEGEAFNLIDKTDYTLTRSYPTFQDFLEQIVRVDPARNCIFENNRIAIEDQFDRALDCSTGGHFLHQPCAAYHFSVI
ncbi:class I SAM-dependent methyltransferase [uncultured Cohaesibacter sp.]|uniref:class I SAM-dependent methyltransferase n=1 Tax=uncultured Cohaesibacter sp. TaxID=1002546 RepID=UPI0029C69E59|nr:class I SAM-dependent methyltransferase [uncultured Cohaesibacter sp.]